MVLSFIALVLVTVMAVGVPGIWLIQEQMERQAWSQVAQASRASEALYAARRQEVADLAVLTAQRPTLRELVTRGEQQPLSSYLATLRTGAGLDLLVVCAPDHQPLVAAGEEIASGVCLREVTAGFHVMPPGISPHVWLLAAHAIGDETADLGRVVVGRAVDDAFVTEIGDQAGLEHTLLVGGQPVATSLSQDLASAAGVERRWSRSSSSAGMEEGTFTLAGHLYYFVRLSLPGADLEDEVALDVADMTATRRRLIGILVGSIATVAAAGSVAGVMLARRIDRPLGRLTETAANMSKGDLESAVTVETGIREIALVAQTLEGARIDLEHTLTRLQEEKAWTEHLLAAIVEGIVTLDPQDRITFFSHGAERITGWRAGDVLNRSCDAVFRSVERDEPFSQLIPAPGRKHKIVVELENGRQATLAVTGARLTPPEEGHAEVALVFRDVSEEEAVHRLLGHFLANVAHEFRTPLSALAASTEMLLDRTSELSVAELETLLSSLHLGVVGLQTLVDNLLESASIEAGRFRVHRRPSDLGEIIAEAMRTMQPLLDKRRQRLTVELPAAIPMVEADPRRTAQVLVNLLSNASKYGPEHSAIAIEATARDGWVRVSVADRGPGIPSAYRRRLFHRFVPPSPGANEAQYGTGLGLSVVKAIVEAHGGQVGVDDRPGGGSIFWFTVPKLGDE
jgi:PAS domain S-box-containing protein